MECLESAPKLDFHTCTHEDLTTKRVVLPQEQNLEKQSQCSRTKYSKHAKESDARLPMVLEAIESQPYATKYKRNEIPP